MFDVRKPSLVAALTVLSLGIAGCRDGQRPPEESSGPGARTVLLVTVDELRSDRLSLYGGSVSMPRLEAVAKNGIVYDDAASVSPMSRPAATTVLAGLTPERSGVRDDFGDRLPETVRTVAERFRDSGARTAAFVTNPIVSYASGLDRGFAVFDGPEDLTFGEGRYYPPIRPAEEAADHFGAWLDDLPRDARWFAWIHLGALHGVATHPDADGNPGEKYAGAAAEVDGAIGVILDRLERSGRKAETRVWILGLFGTFLGEGGARGSAYWLAPETLRVPVVELRPGAGAARVREPIWLPDIAATLAADAGDPLPAGSDGVVLPSGSPGTLDARPRLAWTWATDDRLAWPPLATGETDGRWTASNVPADRAAKPRERSLSRDARAALEAEGFAIGTGGDGWTPETDAERDAFLAEVERVRHYMAEGRSVGTGRTSQRLFEAHPEAFAARLLRLYGGQLLGRLPQAETIGEGLLRTHGEREGVLHWSAHVEYQRGRYARATALLEAAIEIAPSDPDVLYDLACISSLEGRTDDAVGYLETAIGAGFRNWALIERDGDLDALRAEPAFSRLLAGHAR